MTIEQMIEAQNGCHENLVSQTSAAVAGLIDEGKRVSFYSVAKRAGIARSTLYRCDDLRQIVVAARDLGRVSECCQGPDWHADAGELSRRLRLATMERDLLLAALNAESEELRESSFRYALVNFDAA